MHSRQGSLLSLSGGIGGGKVVNPFYFGFYWLILCWDNANLGIKKQEE
jgi:hypothetical protein